MVDEAELVKVKVNSVVVLIVEEEILLKVVLVVEVVDVVEDKIEVVGEDKTLEDSSTMVCPETNRKTRKIQIKCVSIFLPISENSSLTNTASNQF